MKPWKRIEPTKTYKAGYRTLVDKTFVQPDGAIYAPTTIGIEGSEFVAILALTTDHKVIVARQFRPGPEMVMDDLPGGFVDAGEDRTAAAARELLEETGYVAGELTFLGTARYSAYGNGSRHCFLATNCTLADTPITTKEDPHEFIELRFVTIDEIISIAKSGRMTDPGAILMAYDTLQDMKEKK